MLLSTLGKSMFDHVGIFYDVTLYEFLFFFNQLSKDSVTTNVAKHLAKTFENNLFCPSKKTLGMRAKKHRVFYHALVSEIIH